MTNPIRLLGLSLVMALSSAAAAQTTFEPNTDRRTGTDMPPTPIFFGLQRRIPDDISKKPSPPQLAVSASLEGHAGHSKVRSRPYVHKHITFVSEAYEARVKKCVEIGD